MPKKRMSPAQAAMLLATLTMAGTDETVERKEDRLPAPEFTDPCKCGSTKWRWSPSTRTYTCDQCGRKAS